jgi:hypothetical protein
VTPARAEVAPTATVAKDRVAVRIMRLAEMLWNEGWPMLKVGSGRQEKWVVELKVSKGMRKQGSERI